MRPSLRCMRVGMNPDLTAFLKFVGIFVSATFTALTLGQLASCVSHNLMIGLATRKSHATSDECVKSHVLSSF